MAGGAWDALGRGISGGVQAYLTGKQRQEDEKRRIAAEAMDRERLGLAQFQARTRMEQGEDEAALAEQLRAKERHEAPDPRFIGEGIYIPMFEEISPGAFVPNNPEKRYQMYAEQKAAERARLAGLATTEFEREKELAKYRAEVEFKNSYAPAYAAEANRPESSFFLPNGEVNNPIAWAFLQEWIGRNKGDPRSNPQLVEGFLRDVEQMTGIPGAREKAELWLLQQTPGTTTEPGPVGPPGNILEQIRQAVPPAAAAATKVPWPIGFGIPPAIPTGQELRSTGQNIVDKIRGVFTPSPSTGPAASPPPTQAQILAPQVQAPAEAKTLEEFSAEKIAELPYLQGQPPVVLQMLYQQYLSTLRQ